MQSLVLSGSGESGPRWLTRTSLGASNSGKNEDWLQQVLFAHSELIPIKEINPGTEGFVPICRELTIPKVGASVFLDIFGITPEGKLVLIECKLWRNPQARREVVAQLLEYASLVRQWSYGDLTVRVKTALKSTATNPIFECVKAKFPCLEEGSFVDRVSASLRTGDFVLIIAGDGIRSDVHAIADHINQSSGLLSRMALVEFQLWETEEDELVVIPSVPLRTEIVQHRVFTTDDGMPLNFDAAATGDDAEAVIDPDRMASKEAEKAFWQAFIDGVAFDHPDQPKPRHGGHGWVRMAMPEPANWLTGFRTKDGRAGLFIGLKSAEGEAVFLELESAQDQLENDLGFGFKLEVKRAEPFEGRVSFEFVGPPHDDAAFLTWLIPTANSITRTFRPFLSQLASG